MERQLGSVLSVRCGKFGVKQWSMVLHAVLSAVWRSSAVSHGWKGGLIIPILKGKEDQQDSNNYHGITLKYARQSALSSIAERQEYKVSRSHLGVSRAKTVGQQLTDLRHNPHILTLDL